jgi:hypothetical protein
MILMIHGHILYDMKSNIISLKRKICVPRFRNQWDRQLHLYEFNTLELYTDQCWFFQVCNKYFYRARYCRSNPTYFTTIYRYQLLLQFVMTIKPCFLNCMMTDKPSSGDFCVLIVHDLSQFYCLT